MSLVLADRVRETTDSTGTGTITLGGAVTGFQSFSVIGNNNTTYYTIAGGTQWEVGIGTYYGGTLARTTVIASSTGSKIDFLAGTKDVFVTMPSEKSVNLDSSGYASFNGNSYQDVAPISAPAFQEGRVWYDSTQHLLAFYNDVSSAIVHIGQDTQFRVINGTGSTIANGAPVYITSSSSGGQFPYIALAKADVASTAVVIGLVNGSIAAGATGYVTAQGVIDNVNTGTFTVGQVLYLSPYSAGQLMNTVPPTGIAVQVGTVSYVDSSAGRIFVKQTTPLSVSASAITGQVAIANGGTGASTANDALTNLGAYPSSNPSGYTTNLGTVTSVNATGTVSGLTLSGTVTSSGDITLGGAITGFATSGANTNLTSVALTSGTISTAPSNANDIVNKTYADSIATGINFHAACNYATIAALAANTYNNGSSGVGATLTANANGTLTIDGYTLVSGDVGKRLLIKNEATGANNGIYTLTQAGTAGLPYILTRATDYDTSGSGTNEIDAGDFILVLSGSTLANTSWVQQTALPITVGTTAITFLQFGASGSGTVTSVSGTGTVSGLTLTGTVTSSGNLTLGGTLDLSSPPAIGGTTPAAGTYTTLNLTGTTNQVSSVAVSSDPAAPSAGNLKTFARTIAGGYTAPAFLNATQNVAMLQPAFANKRIGNLFPINSAAPTIVGLNAFTGTLSSVTPATTSMFTRANRSTVSSTATAGTLANYYQNTASYTLGSATTPAYGGFYFVIRFGIADTVASPRSFFGLSSTVAAPTNVEPSTLINSIGIGQGAANTNLFVYYGGSAAQTPIDLGSNFPTGTSNTDLYELTLFAPPTSNNTVYYQVIRLNTGNVASGTLTGTAGTVLPSNTTYLAIRNWRTNNATASAVTIAIAGLYTETDY